MDVLSLRGERFTFSIETIPPSPTEEGWFELFVELVADDIFLRTRASLKVEHVRDLADYFRSHIGPDRPHSIESSEEWVSSELDFQIHAFEGELESLHDGYFSLEIMVVSISDDGETRLYQGVRGAIETAEVLRWCDQLDELSGR